MRALVMAFLFCAACSDGQGSVLSGGRGPMGGGGDPGDMGDPNDPTDNSGNSGNSSGDAALAQICVDFINEKRATVGAAPLARWSDKETCSDGQAQKDAQTNTPHGSFPSCTEMAQNECPGWGGDVTKALRGCLEAMWKEGPGGGHYENMRSTRYTKVACGVHVTSSGKMWSVQNFR
jgi:hypothetical protein